MKSASHMPFFAKGLILILIIIYYDMPKFLSGTQLYETILQKSSNTKNTLLVCASSLGLDSHEVFSQEILKNPPANMRFVFPINEVTVKNGKINPYELQYLIERLKGIEIKSKDNLHSNFFVFDDSALFTSGGLTKTTFQSNIETGVLLDYAEAEEIKRFFNEQLWNASKSTGDIKKYKQMWNATQKTNQKTKIKKVVLQTEIKPWTNDYVNTWYIGVVRRLSPKLIHKIRKESFWPSDFSILGDIGYRAYLQLRLHDRAYITDFSKRGKIAIESAHIVDKARIETDEGDHHIAYKTEKTYLLERGQIYDMLKNAKIVSRSSEIVIRDDQIEQITKTLSSPKRKRKKKPSPKMLKTSAAHPKRKKLRKKTRKR
jgi:hypothetical protein